MICLTEITRRGTEKTWVDETAIIKLVPIKPKDSDLYNGAACKVVTKIEALTFFVSETKIEVMELIRGSKCRAG